MRSIQRFGLVLALLAALVAFATPAHATQTVFLNTFLASGHTTITPDTEETIYSDLQNTSGSDKSIIYHIELPVGWYFNSDTVYNGPAGWSCDWPYLRIRDCYVVVPAGTTKRFTTVTKAGEGLLSPVSMFTRLTEGGTWTETETDNYTRGSNWFTFTWSASWLSGSRTHGQSYVDSTFLSINYPTARQASVTIYMEGSTLTSGALYIANTSTQIGSCSYYLNFHGIVCSYNSWVSGFTAELRFGWTVKNATGVDLLQSTARDDSGYIGGNTGSLSSDISRNVTIN